MDTIISSVRGSLKLVGFTTTGLAQPNPPIIKAKDPMRSRCTKGFIVRRPIIRGVGSPSKSAALAWAYSCPAAAMISAGMDAIIIIKLNPERIILLLVI